MVTKSTRSNHLQQTQRVREHFLAATDVNLKLKRASRFIIFLLYRSNSFDNLSKAFSLFILMKGVSEN